MEWLIPYKLDEETPSAAAKVAPSTFAGCTTFPRSRIFSSPAGWGVGNAVGDSTVVNYITDWVAQRLRGAVTGV